VKHFECPQQDWSEDVEDDAQGYTDLYLHEIEFHSRVAPVRPSR